MEEGGERWCHRVEEEGEGYSPCGERVSECSLTCSAVSLAVQFHLQCSVTCCGVSFAVQCPLAMYYFLYSKCLQLAVINHFTLVHNVVFTVPSLAVDCHRKCRLGRAEN